MAEPMTKPDTMSKTAEPITIKKYANRRLYNTGTSTYVTLEDLAAMVKTGEDFVVYDAKTGEDITRSVLTQIIFEQENKEGQNLLPITFLRQLIRFYGDSMQMLVPRYLEVSIESLTREQEKFRQQMAQAFGVGAFTSLEEQVRRNMEMFERTFAMFAPFRAARRSGRRRKRSGSRQDAVRQRRRHRRSQAAARRDAEESRSPVGARRPRSLFPPPHCGGGGGRESAAGGGTYPLAQSKPAPSTMLCMVPLPRCAGGG